MAAKNADPLTNPLSVEMGAQSWTNTCGVCHVGGGQMEYNRDLADYGSAGEGNGDAYVIKYARIDDPATGVDETSWTNVELGWMSDTNKAEMDCLMCHLDGSNAGSAWLKTLDCGPGNPIGPMTDPTCSGTPMFPGTRTVTLGNGVTDYDMYNRNFGLKQRRNDLIASMGAGAKGTFTGSDLTGVDWGQAGPIVVAAGRVAYTPKSENCSVCHARDDNTMGLPGMMAMKTGYGNYGLIHDPSNSMPSGNMGADSDLDTDNGVGAANDDYWFDFGCKTGMGKRAHKVSSDNDPYGVNGRYGMSMFLPSTLDMDPTTVPNAGDPVPGKMPDIDVHDRNGMECASCHYAVGSTTGTGFEDIPAGEHHGFDYPAERIYAMDHQFAQADSFPDTKGKNNLDAKIRCDGCHTTRDNPKLTDNGGTLVAPTPLHNGLPQLHLDKIGCVTCHVPETYSAPGRLKYRDWTAGFARGTFRNVLDWNFNLVEGNHNTVPSVRKWATKNGETKIYPVLPSLLPTWYEMVPNSGVIAANDAGMPVDDNLFDADTTLLYPSPVKNRDLQRVGEWVRDNTAAGADFRLNGGNTVPLFDGFQIVDSWEVDTVDEIDAMMSAFNAGANGSDARNVQFLNVIQADFDVTHGVVPKDWALGGSERGGCVSCHSSMNAADPNYSPFSIGFFEGYTQPVANAGMPGFAVGAYEMAKNWMGMFADFDAALMCGMNDPSLMANDGMGGMANPNTDHHNYYFNPFTGEPNMTAECSPMSWFSNNPMFGTSGVNAQLQHVVGMMTTTFDQAMGFPSGSSMQMGMYDGVAGIQGFTLKELQTAGTLGCNPFGGPINFSPMPDMNMDGLSDQSVNNCMPDYVNAVPNPMYAGMINGTCTGPAVGPAPASCEGGFRNNGACSPANPAGADIDCQGLMSDPAEIAHNPLGLLLGRAEAVSHFKTDLQQSFKVAGDPTSAKVKWSAGGDQNPSNPTHMNKWDQAQYCYDYMNGPNPMTPAVDACMNIQAAYDANIAGGGACATGNPADGFPASGSMDCKLHIATAMSANQFLGYTPDVLALLMTPGIAQGQNTYQATAHLSALHDTNVNNLVELNASRSECSVLVDGALTPWADGCNFSWDTNGGTIDSTNGSDTLTVDFGAPGDYDVSVTVCLNDNGATSADESGVCDTDTVTATAMIVEDPGVANSLIFTNDGAGTCTIAGDPEDVTRAYIYWGNRTRTVVTDPATEFPVTHSCGSTVRVKLYDAAYNTTNLIL